MGLRAYKRRAKRERGIFKMRKQAEKAEDRIKRIAGTKESVPCHFAGKGKLRLGK